MLRDTGSRSLLAICTRSMSMNTPSSMPTAARPITDTSRRIFCCFHAFKNCQSAGVFTKTKSKRLLIDYILACSRPCSPIQAQVIGLSKFCKLSSRLLWTIRIRTKKISALNSLVWRSVMLTRHSSTRSTKWPSRTNYRRRYFIALAPCLACALHLRLL